MPRRSLNKADTRASGQEGAMVFFFNQIKSKNHFCHATQNRHDHAKLDQLTIGEMWLHAGMQGRIQLAFGPGQCSGEL